MLKNLKFSQPIFASNGLKVPENPLTGIVKTQMPALIQNFIIDKQVSVQMITNREFVLAASSLKLTILCTINLFGAQLNRQVR